MYFRVTRSGKNQYLQIARSYRDGKSVRQQTLISLGRLDILRSSGQLDALIRSGLRLCEKLAVIDAHNAGETEAATILSIGPDLVFGRLWQASGIKAALDIMLQERRYEFDVERAIYMTVLHRLFISGSDRAAEVWRENYHIPGTEGLELHHLYRAMAFWGSPLKDAELVLGRPRCVKDEIEEGLFDRRRDLFTEVDLVFFDTTSIYFEGQGGRTLGRYGHSKDHRPDLKQMIVGIALDSRGWPLCCEMWPGNTTDVKTLPVIVERMKQKFRVRRICIIADRGMIRKKTMQALDKEEPPALYILGVRMRRQKEVSGKVLTKRGAWQEIHGERKWSKDPAPLKIREVVLQERRYIVCLNEEERRKDAHDRQAIIAHLRDKLKQGDKSLVGNKGYRRFLKMEGKGHFVVDEGRIKNDERFDGVWVLRTNTDYPAEKVALAYKSLWMVEDIIRTTKSILDTRPIYHKCDETIRGHVFCSFLALLLKAELEKRLTEKGEDWEWREVIRGLDNLRETEVAFRGQRFCFRSQLTGHAYQAIRAAGTAMPPSIRKV
ncbi:MAG: transposase [Syntrophobacterales bacterium CG_4_8_14_3_um_filter_49_14]|nr:MAG: transposase [Syntrophobacterales bacterium CG23_combo_of_CG06-09_8_20_14_all_48_27]PJC75523.1 MAG: transposase [Syntrophobacterales bacterium CG_4_8_14_3_um_filter_49_14]